MVRGALVGPVFDLAPVNAPTVDRPKWQRYCTIPGNVRRASEGELWPGNLIRPRTVRSGLSARTSTITRSSRASARAAWGCVRRRAPDDRPKVAVKVLKREFAEDTVLVNRFFNEARGERHPPPQHHRDPGRRHAGLRAAVPHHAAARGQRSWISG